MKLTRCHFYMIVLLLFAVPFSSIADVVRSGTDGFTPPDAARGAVAGSYPLEGLDTVNLFNRTVNFELPLAMLHGRGSVAANFTLTINRGFVGVYNESGGQSWYSINMYVPSGPVAKLTSQKIASPTYENLTCPLGSFPTWLTSRFKFTMPDGSEYVFHDVAQNGATFKINNLCIPPPNNNRGRVFITSDVTAATLIVDSDVIDQYLPAGYLENPASGLVILRDGTRYRFQGGRLAWIQDRNGNRVTYGWGSDPNSPSSITDSIGRKIEIIQGIPAGGYTVRTKGFNGALRDVKVYKAPLSAALRQGSTPKTYGELFPETGDTYGTTPFSDDVVSRVELPNGKSYFFYYNAYAELARVILPTGGGYDYEYPPVGESGFESLTLIADRPLSKRTVYHTLDAGTDPNNPPTANVVRKELYSREDVSGDRIITVETRDGNNALFAKSKHYFYDHSPSACSNPLYYATWWKGKEHKTEYFQINGGVAGQALRTVEQTWDPLPAGLPPCPPPVFGIVTPWPNPKIIETKTTIEGNLISKETYSYDSYHNQTDVYQYDFGVGAPGPLIRRTHTDYVTLNNGVDYAADTNIHIRNLHLRQQVFDAGGTKRAETFYEYDLYDNSPNHAPLIDRLGISGLDSGFTTGYTTRGNVTRTSSALLNNSGGVTGWVNSHAQYDIAGNLVKAVDGRGVPIDIDFSDCFGFADDEARSNSGAPELAGGVSYAFPTKVTNVLGHTAYTQYDYYLGAPVNSEDANGIVSSVAYNDALDRPTQGIRARYKVTTPPCAPPSVCEPAEKRQTTITYDDANHVITTTSDLTTFNDNFLTAESYYDGLGRTWRSAAYEGATWTIKDTRFDALGRVSQVSNPYRAADPGSASPPANLWTTTDYDARGRVIQVTTPDTAAVNTEYSGNRTLVIDQAGVKRISQIDALGRLTNVWEVRSPDAASGTVSVSFPNHPEITAGYQTDYLYDSLGNLRKVIQGAQTRWFAYDSLSRLIRVKNPEQDTNSSLPPHTDPVTGGSGWCMAYSYDANGNLVSKTNARNITTTYGYDTLNRNTSVDYSDITAINPDIMRQYDGATNGKGRFWADYAGGFNPTDQVGEHNVIGSYDALGRPLTRHHLFKVNGVWSAPYSVSQIYDLAGNVTTMTYPSLREVNYSYDNAGRLSSFSGNLGGSPRTYADTIGYNAAGQMIKERFGTNTSLYHNRHYNNRQQLASIRVGDNPTYTMDWSRVAIDFFYGTTAVVGGNPFADDTDNNGNLRRQITHVPLAGGGYVIPQLDDYTYDALNRISSFTETQRDSGGQWISAASQNYSYDPYGNRRVTGATGGVNNYNPTYDLGSNRIVGLGYDQAGNITSDVLTGGTMIYDAENRLLTASAGGGGTYTYDASGKRTRRTAGGQETWYVYGVGGELLAEYATNAVPSAPQKEYGYRGGQLLIIAESGSGGGTSFVKPASQSKSDLIGKIGPVADGAANRIFSADEPFINNGYGSLTADSSDSDNDRTLVRSGPRAPAEEYGNAPSANGSGGELLAEHPSGAAPSAPQKEYRNRRGLSIVTPQTSSVVTVYPTAYQTPNGSGGPIDNPSNTDGSASLSITNGSATETCRWYGFPNVSGQIISARLKMNWSASGSVNGTMGGGGGFSLTYTGGGASASLSNNSQSSSVDFLLPAGQDLTQVQVGMSLNGGAGPNTTFSGNASVSNIRLEVEVADTTAPVITGMSSSAVTHNSATISWITNENSDSQVEYRTNTGSWQTTALNPALVTTHAQILSGLTAGTVYYYRVKSRDAAGNLAVSGDFTFTTLSGNAAAFVSQSVLATMTAGEAYAVTVTMLNQGTTTWTPGQAYRLGSQNPQDNTTWATNRVGLLPGDSVSPGATTTFSFVVTAPSSPGSYNFQWQMVQDGVEWFGAKTPNVAVQVVPPFTKLKEYVYAGGRLVTSEEMSCVPTLSPLSTSSPQGGGPGSFSFSMPSICSWTATSNVGWITLTGSSSGSGNGTVNYSVAQNSGPQRVGTITVNGQAFNITQAPNPASCGYSLNKTNDTFPQEGGSRPLALTAGAGCAWNAVSSDTSWLSASPTNGVGSATINYSVTANGGQQRAGSISITAGGQTFATFTVTQLPNQASCTFAFSPGSKLVGVGGENGVFFNVTTGAGCLWNAENNNGWITITGGATNNTGNGTVSFNVHANNGGSRIGSILVRGQVFTVTQCGSHEVSPITDSFGRFGGTGSITVSTAAGCPWSATSDAWFINITSGANGAGNGVVNYSVASANKHVKVVLPQSR